MAWAESMTNPKYVGSCLSTSQFVEPDTETFSGTLVPNMEKSRERDETLTLTGTQTKTKTKILKWEKIFYN